MEIDYQKSRPETSYRYNLRFLIDDLILNLEFLTGGDGMSKHGLTAELTIENVVRFLTWKAYSFIDKNNEIMEARHKERRKRKTLDDKTSFDEWGLMPQARIVADNNAKVQHYFRAAFDIAKEFELDTKMVNFVVLEYAARFQNVSWIMRSQNLPNPEIIIGFIKLGASSTAIEVVLGKYLKAGYRHRTLELANILGRKLTSEEIWLLIKKYNDGPSRSDEEEQELKELAWDHLSPKEAERVSECIRKGRKRFDNAS